VTLAELLLQAAATLPAVTPKQIGETVEWTVRGRPFAAAAGGRAEYRLEPRIAKAALGTPDTGPSPRGRDWIAFQPAELDRFAIDRATAWLASAHRHAAALRN
jgi:hypothetical protein